MLHQRLRELREQHGLNRKQFAALLNTKYTTYVGYENGEREPGSDFIIAVSDAFDVSTDYLLGISDKKERLSAHQLTGLEFDLIEKYRTLDEYGKDMVSTVVEKEYKRAHSTANAQRDYTRSVLTLAANADKAEPGSLSDDVLNNILAQADKLLRREKPRNDE